MSRQEDFMKKLIEYSDRAWEDGKHEPLKIISSSDFVNGAEYGYQYAVEKVLKELFMIELSNFFPELDEVNTTDGQQRLIECIKQAMEE